MGTFAVVGLAALGCMAFGPQVEARDDFSYMKDAGTRKALVLDNTNGTITVTGVDGLTSVEVSAVKIVKAGSMDDAKSHLSDIKINVEESDAALKIHTDQPNGGVGRSYTVNYQIKVPSAWMVSVENVNGSVSLAGVKNNVATQITNGDFSASALAGNVDIELTNGGISGDMKIPEKGSCTLTTTNGTISTKLDVVSIAKASIETTNGAIKLSIPQSASASISAESSVGRVKVANLQLKNLRHDRDGFTGESVSGTLGNGGGTIDLDVTNGEIALDGY
jgi:DUF4097 and DUF4098 domain-containing protein YvlB